MPSKAPFFLLTIFLPILGQSQKIDSTQKAEAIAEKVLVACGGEDRWEKSCYFHWNFFGKRSLWWDKQEHRVRIGIPEKELIITADLDSMTGKAWIGGKAVNSKDSLELLVQQAHRIWINDSYWLFMPFKMLDPGVKLKWLGSETRDFFGESHKIEMSFDGVGITPQNKYHVWVDEKEHLVRHWAYFPDRSSQKPVMKMSWSGYEEYNELKLASERGDRKIKDISVPDSFPKGTFNELDPFQEK